MGKGVKTKARAREMAQKIKALAAKPDDEFNWWAHMVEGRTN